MLAVAALLLGGAANCAAQPAPSARVAFIGNKGVNLHSWMTWTPQTSPTTYRLPVFAKPAGALSDQEMARLHAAGFNFVRLTVDPGVFVLLKGPARDDALQTLTTAINRLNQQNLSVIVDMHPVRAVLPFGPQAGGGDQPFEKGPDSPFSQRYATDTAWLAGQLDRSFGASRRVAFELMNEPDVACGDAGWTAQEIALHKEVRAAAPRLTLILTGACWDGIDGLVALDPAAFADDNTLYTFHFYDDHDFTHAGLKGPQTPADLARSVLGGLPYPWDARPQDQVLAQIASQAAPYGPQVSAVALQLAKKYLDKRWDRTRIEARMDMVVHWAAAHGVAPTRILMGEFGVDGRNDKILGQLDGDRSRWLTDVRQAAEARGFRWSLWQYRGNGFNDFWDLETDRTGALNPKMLQSLGLTATP